MNELKCIICDKKFKSKRADTKFCSPACRKKGSRRKAQPSKKEVKQKNKVVAMPIEPEEKPLPPLKPIKGGFFDNIKVSDKDVEKLKGMNIGSRKIKI